MTVSISRELTVPASPERVWEFIADPDNRAAAISVVQDWEPADDGGTIWHVKLPIPVVNRTIRVETRDRERDPPEKVTFVGRSKIFRVRGEHELAALDDGTHLTSRFMVDGKAPGVESFFKRRLDGELDNLETALIEWLEDGGGIDREDEGEGKEAEAGPTDAATDATRRPESAESPESPENPEDADSPESAESPESAGSPESPEDADEAAEER